MIERLILQRFGRFENRSFVFNRSVVFHGPNESGKTTVFDALFTRLCRVPRKGTNKSDIYERYGERMDASLVPESAHEAFDPQEFRDLYAIRSGDVALHFNEGSSWAATVKSALFSGGIDPAAVAEAVELLASEKGNVKHNREIAERRSRLAELREQARALEEKRVRHAGKGKESERLKEQLAEIAGRIAAAEREIASLEEDLRSEEAIRQRNGLEETYALLDREETVQGRIAALAPLPADAGGRVRAQEAAVTRLEAELHAAGQTTGRLAAELRSREGERAEIERQQSDGRAAAQRAEILGGRINEFLGDASKRMTQATEWNIPVALASGIAAVAAVACGIFVDPLCFAGLLIPLTGLFFVRRTHAVEDHAAAARLCAEVRDQFRLASGQELKADTPGGILEELRAFVARHEGLQEDIRRSGAEVERVRASLRAAETAREETDAKLRDARTALAGMFQEFGVTDRDALSTRIADRKNLVDQHTALAASVNERIAAGGFPGREQLVLDVRRRLAEADAAGVPRSGRNAPEVQRMIRRLAALREERTSLERDRTALLAARARLEGGAEEFGVVLEELLDKEKEIMRLEVEIADLELNKKGAALAAEIFRAMAADSTGMLAGLAADMEALFGGLVAVPRTVKVDAFNDGGIRATDAAGVLREAGHLSKGTRDTLTFAARLALALKADPAGTKRLLVLDEPFASLDPRRTADALALVRRVQEERDWQVVLFTKDPLLADAAMAVLRDPVRHDLGPSGAGA